MTDSNTQLTAIGFDAPCRRCNYNLRGLNRDGRCPECSFEISKSLIGKHLSHINPAWVSRIHKGTLLSGWGWVVTGILAAIGLIRILIPGPMFLDPFLDLAGTVLFPLNSSVIYMGGLLFALAPPNVFDKRITRNRILFLGLSTTLYSFVVALALIALLNPTGIPWFVKTAMHMLIFLLLPCLEMLRAQWLSVLCRQIPDDRLHDSTRLFARILAGLFVGTSFFLLIARGPWFGLDWRGTQLDDYVFGLSLLLARISWCIAVFIASLFGLYTIHLSREFRLQAELAATNWLQDLPPDNEIPTRT